MAAAAAISRASLHRLFATRAALVEGIAVRAGQRVNAALAAAGLDEGPALEAIARLTDRVTPVVHRFAFLAAEAQVQHPRRFEQVDQGVDEHLLALFRRGRAGGAPRPELPALWLVRADGGRLSGLASGAQRGDVAPRDAARLMLATLLRGAAAPTAGAKPAHHRSEVRA
jgi:AcrR family transcriptional regulator